MQQIAKTYAKSIILVFAIIVVCGISVSRTLQAQPSKPRIGVWNGTNKHNISLHLEEDNTNFRHGPVFSGYLRHTNRVHTLYNISFDYGDNTFRAEYTTHRKTNTLEILYYQGNETNGIAVGLWDGEHVTFYCIK